MYKFIMEASLIVVGTSVSKYRFNIFLIVSPQNNIEKKI